MFWRQYRKELAAYRSDILLPLGALVVWYGFLATRIGSWPSPLIVMSAIMPIGFLHLWALWTSLQLYRREWRENTHFLLLSLPVPAWKITGPKLAVLLTGVIVISAMLFAGVISLASATGLLQEGLEIAKIRSLSVWDLVDSGLKIYGLLLLSYIGLAVITQLSFVLSRLFHRFQGVWLGGFWLFQIWFVGRLSEWIGPFFNWMPRLDMKGLAVLTGSPEVASTVMDTGSLWVSGAVGIGLFLLLNVTLSRAVEAT